jgi:uncharacterized protein
MKNLEDIKSVLVSHKHDLFERYPIESLAIFGSYARNDQSDTSDLDVMVEFNDRIGIRFIDLAEELENILKMKIDLVSKKGIKEKYLKSIDTDLIYV